MVTLEQKDRNSGHKAACHCSVGILIRPSSLGSVMCLGRWVDIGVPGPGGSQAVCPGKTPAVLGPETMALAAPGSQEHLWVSDHGCPQGGWGILELGCLDDSPREPLPALSSVWNPGQP